MSDQEWLRLVDRVLSRFAESEADKQEIAERLHDREGYRLARAQKASDASDRVVESLLIRELKDMGLEPLS